MCVCVRRGRGSVVASSTVLENEDTRAGTTLITVARLTLSLVQLLGAIRDAKAA